MLNATLNDNAPTDMAAFLEAALADDSTIVPARAGDIVVYENLGNYNNSASSSSPSSSSSHVPPQWHWAVGEVLRQPTSRITEIRIWRKKEKLLDMTERMKSDQLRNSIAKKKEELEREKELVLSDQNSIAYKRLTVQQKMEAAQYKITAAYESIGEAQRLVAAVTDKQWAEVRGYASPPNTVRLVLEAVLLLLATPFTKGDWKAVRERVRDKDFIRLVSNYSQRIVESQNNNNNTAPTTVAGGGGGGGARGATAFIVDPVAVQLVEDEYLPQLTTERVAHSSKAAVALHAWVASTCYAMAALKEMAFVQEEIVLLDFEISELGEDSNTNLGKIKALEREVKKMEDELAALFAEAEAMDDMFLMTTINTARGPRRGGGGDVLGGTFSDVGMANKSEFYSTLDTKFILSSQIFANLEHDVERTKGRSSANAGGSLAASSSLSQQQRLADTLFIDPLKVLMTARGACLTARGGGGGEGGSKNAAAMAFFSGTTNLPDGFKLAVPPVNKNSGSLPSDADNTSSPSSSAALQEENARLKEANADAAALIERLQKELAAAKQAAAK